MGKRKINIERLIRELGRLQHPPLSVDGETFVDLDPMTELNDKELLAIAHVSRRRKNQ